MKKELKDIIAENTNRLAKSRGLKSGSLGDKSNLDQKTVYNLMNPSEARSNPTLQTIQSTARGLRTNAWQLLFADMPIDLFDDKKLDKMIKLYAQCSPKNRMDIFQQIEKIAHTDQMEKRLKELEEKKQQ